MLASLLDLLSEDLNLVLKQPPPASLEFNNKLTENEFYWKVSEDFKQRNDSLINQLFYGHFKTSTLCPACNYQGLKFEPFNMLSLPIKTTEPIEKKINVLFYDEYTLLSPTAYTVGLTNWSTVRDLKNNLCRDRASNTMLFLFDRLNRGHELLEDDNVTLRSIEEYRNPDQTYILYDCNYRIDFSIVTHHTTHMHDIPVIYFDFPLSSQSSGQAGGGSLWDWVSSLSNFGSEGTGSAVSTALGGPGSWHPYIVHSFLPSVSPSELYQYIWSCIAKMAKVETSFDEAFKDKHHFPFLLKKTRRIAQPDLESVNSGIEDISEAELILEPFDLGGVSVERSEIIEIIQLRRDLQALKSFQTFSIAGYEQRDLSKASLFDCLDELTKMESLDEGNQWSCPKCNKSTQAKVFLRLKSLPEVLIIHLKRFSHAGQNLEKFTGTVEIPLKDLELNKYIADQKGIYSQAKYELFGVVNHQGSLSRGHYTSLTKLKKKANSSTPSSSQSSQSSDEEWVLFDDTSVKRGVDIQDFLKEQPYILFYRRTY